MNDLQRGQSWETRGHNAKTLVKYPNLRVVLMVLKRGARLSEHKTVDRLSIHTVVGQIRVRLSEQPVDLPVGCLLVLEGAIPHDVEALEDSAVLLTLASEGVRG
jgi:quercetin dioxygenase-like cupin family protein